MRFYLFQSLPKHTQTLPNTLFNLGIIRTPLPATYHLRHRQSIKRQQHLAIMLIYKNVYDVMTEVADI